MTRKSWIAVIGVVLTSTACTPSAAPATTVQVNGDVLEIDGRLLTGTAQQVKDLLRTHPEVRRLVISSTGGSVPEAWDIGRLVNDRGISVEVSGFCSSACTDVFFAGTAGRTIRPNGVLAFHSSLWTKVYAASRSEFAPAEWPKPDPVELEADFLRFVGVSLALQQLPARVSHPTCVALVGPAQLGLQSFGNESVHTLFVPSRRLLAALGVKDIKGDIPESESEMRQLLAHYPVNPAASIAFADVDALQWPIPQGPFPKCSWNVPGQMPPGLSNP
jgi:hypothetical protein